MSDSFDPTRGKGHQKFRITQTDASADGQFELKCPPGYYVDTLRSQMKKSPSNGQNMRIFKITCAKITEDEVKLKEKVDLSCLKVKIFWNFSPQ